MYFTSSIQDTQFILHTDVLTGFKTPLTIIALPWLSRQNLHPGWKEILRQRRTLVEAVSALPHYNDPMGLLLPGLSKAYSIEGKPTAFLLLPLGSKMRKGDIIFLVPCVKEMSWEKAKTAGRSHLIL